MTSRVQAFAALPAAPVAELPPLLADIGSARVTWQPNILRWASVWRLVVLVQGVLAAALASGTRPDMPVTWWSAAAWTLVTAALARWGPVGRTRTALLSIDLVVCMGLLATAPTQPVFALMALFSYSCVLTWAAERPVNAFPAAGLLASAYVVFGLTGPYGAERPGTFTGNLVLYLFFALASSGFFTVAHRIGALEIAAEVSKERGRYRRDLHDRLGQALCGLHFELQALNAGGTSDVAPQRLTSLADGYGEAHRMLDDLFSQTDEPLLATDVGSLIRQEARRMSTQAGVRIDVSITGDTARVPPWMRPHIWSIAGECMTNALKNGQAQGIDIDLSVVDELLVLSVTDDGVGFDNPPGTITEKEGHYGLREMAERARLCGGEVVVASQPGFGTRVRLQAPMPIGGTDELLERDTGTLRRNTFSLFVALRTSLGIVAIVQLAAGLLGGGPSGLLALLVLVLTTIDVVVPAMASRYIPPLTSSHEWIWVAVAIAEAAIVALALTAGLQPAMLLYAPTLLIGAGILGGRRAAARALAASVVAVAAGTGLAHLNDQLDGGTLRSMLIHGTNLVIIGLCAIQGARLLDRLETLQIRVRYQALARMRQGLSTRMRDDLVRRLDELEVTARDLATGDWSDEEAFRSTTDRLTSGSAELKARLRAIVHQLADPSPPRETTHV